MLRCFISKQLVTVLMVPIFHVSGKHSLCFSFIHITSNFSLLPAVLYCSFVTGLTVTIRPQGSTVNMISSTALASAISIQTPPYLPPTPLLCNKLKFQTHPRWGALSCENAMMTCRQENYDHQVMRWNGLIWLYLLKCAYLSNGTALWITLSSYLVLLPESLLCHFFCFFFTFTQLLISFFHHLYCDYYPLHCLGTCCRYDLSHCFSLFRWLLFKSYLSRMSPSILSSLPLNRNIHILPSLQYAKLWESGSTCSASLHHRSQKLMLPDPTNAFEYNTASTCTLTCHLLV